MWAIFSNFEKEQNIRLQYSLWEYEDMLVSITYTLIFPHCVKQTHGEEYMRNKSIPDAKCMNLVLDYDQI